MFKKVKQFCIPAIGAISTFALTVPSFAAEPPAVGTIDPAVFEPMVTSVTGNVSALLPSVIVVVGLVTSIGIVIALFKRHARGT